MPWCPKCGYEYKVGYKICSDCNVDLVDSLDKSDDPLLSDNVYENFGEFENEDSFLEETESEFVDDDLEVNKKKTINAKNNVYVDANVRATEYKLGAVTLLMVGIIGIVVIILMDIGVIPFLPSVSRVMLNIVMGGLFLIFIVMGISSISSYKDMLELAKKEEKMRNDIEGYFKNNVSPESLDLGDVSNLTKEEICLKQYEQISRIINENFEDVDSVFLEYITEKIYVNMFE